MHAEVLFPFDDSYYEGVITGFSAADCKHSIRYLIDSKEEAIRMYMHSVRILQRGGAAEEEPEEEDEVAADADAAPRAGADEPPPAQLPADLPALRSLLAATVEREQRRVTALQAGVERAAALERTLASAEAKAKAATVALDDARKAVTTLSKTDACSYADRVRAEIARMERVARHKAEAAAKEKAAAAAEREYGNKQRKMGALRASMRACDLGFTLLSARRAHSPRLRRSRGSLGRCAGGSGRRCRCLSGGRGGRAGQ